MSYKSIIITCEHAGNVVPEKYISLFAGAEEVLKSHRGWDPGAFEVANGLADQLHAPLFSMAITRLLIEMNRSLDSAALFSEFTSALSPNEKTTLIAEFYSPYYHSIEEAILQSEKPTLHLSIHSFTPVFNGTSRFVDIGLLFDPASIQEKEFCVRVKKMLDHQLPEFKTVFNEPYKGTDDGIAEILRKKFPGSDYLGIEIELNQKFAGTPFLMRIQEALCNAIRSR